MKNKIKLLALIIVPIFLLACEMTNSEKTQKNIQEKENIKKTTTISDTNKAHEKVWSTKNIEDREKSTEKLKIINEATNGVFTISLAKGSIIDSPGTEAIANAANDKMKGGSAIDGVILKFAHTGEPGGQDGYYSGPIVEQSQKYMKDHNLTSVPEGMAFAVDAGEHFNKIGVNYVIQVNGTKQDNEAAFNAFYNAMKAASEKGAKSIAIPGISTGLFNFPKDKAAELFIKAALKFAQDYPTSPLKHIRFLDLNDEMIAAVNKEMDKEFLN
jgi:O-acetyl-ADP-ribose deacetylase (regulator of RNase III)